MSNIVPSAPNLSPVRTMDKTASSPYLNQKLRSEAQARADIERKRYLRESDPHFLRRILDGAVEVERDEHGRRITRSAAE